MWTLLGQATGGAVLESLWLGLRPVVEEGLARAGVSEVVEVWCEVPVEVARSRYGRRTRHPIHPYDDNWAFWEKHAEPLGLGVVHKVDTTRPVEISDLAALCRNPRRSPA